MFGMWQRPGEGCKWGEAQVVEHFLWDRQHFRLPRLGRSNVPEMSKVDHPGDLFRLCEPNGTIP